MRVLFEKFYAEPVFALAVVQAAVAGVVVAFPEAVVIGIAGIVVGALEAAKRQLVTPTGK